MMMLSGLVNDSIALAMKYLLKNYFLESNTLN